MIYGKTRWSSRRSGTTTGGSGAILDGFSRLILTAFRPVVRLILSCFFDFFWLQDEECGVPMRYNGHAAVDGCAANGMDRCGFKDDATTI